MIEINDVSVKRVGSILLELGYLVFTYDKSTKKLNSFDLNNLNLEDFVINIICINKDRKSEIESLIEEIKVYILIFLVKVKYLNSIK